jgi:hypothetical protein
LEQNHRLGLKWRLIRPRKTGRPGATWTEGSTELMRSEFCLRHMQEIARAANEKWKIIEEDRTEE